MELLTKSCEICGGDLEKIGDKIYRCSCCKNEFADVEKQPVEQQSPDLGTVVKKVLTQKLDDLKKGNFSNIVPFTRKQADDESQRQTLEANEIKAVICAHQREVSKPQRLVHIEIPEGTYMIENGAFENCVNLESVVIPDTVTRIEDSAFKGCRKLRSIVIPSSVTYIGSFVFQDCVRLKSILFPQSVQVVDRGALAGCIGLESITIPFVGLTREQAYAQSKQWSDLGYSCITHFGVIFGAQDYVEQHTAIPPKLAKVTISGGYDIDDNAFWGCAYIRKVTIAKTVTYIGRNAFSGCRSLKYVIFQKPMTWKKWDCPDKIERGSLLNRFSTPKDNSIPEEILNDPEKAAKAITKTYSEVRWVSQLLD